MKARIIDHLKLTDTYFKLTLLSKEISALSYPGQFVNILCSKTTDPLLRRPFAIHNTNKDKMLFEVLYEVVGAGTRFLTERKIGEELDLIGPLGSGFTIDPDKKIAIIAAGGMGIAPLFGLAQATKKKYPAVYFITGQRRQDSVILSDELFNLGIQIIICTDDGTAGKKGTASDMLEELLENEIKQSMYDESIIYCCGPKAMLKEICAISLAKKIDCQVSVEQKMACGIGACLGCTIETRDGFKLACKDGPVFNAREVKW